MLYGWSKVQGTKSTMTTYITKGKQQQEGDTNTKQETMIEKSFGRVY